MTLHVYFYCKIILMLVNMVKSSMLFHSSSFFPLTTEIRSGPLYRVRNIITIKKGIAHIFLMHLSDNLFDYAMLVTTQPRNILSTCHGSVRNRTQMQDYQAEQVNITDL